MDDDNLKTELIDSSASDLISTKLAAVNNNVRFAILEILRDFQKIYKNKDNSFKKDPLYSREINNILLNNYKINIIRFLSDELLSFFNIYKTNQRFIDGEHCVLTIFNGVDKGKTFKVNKNETVFIGRKAHYSPTDIASFSILLDNSYNTVSNIDKPHLKLFYKVDSWFVLDESSSNGTFIHDHEIRKGFPIRLRNNSFIKLSKGSGSAIIYCSFE